jgi:glucose-6-phosphate 1-dehydrogenase
MAGVTPAPSSDALVLFGGTGDLARRKIYPALLALSERGELDIPVIAVARKALRADGLREFLRETVPQVGTHRAGFSKLGKRLDYVQGDYGDPATFSALGRLLRSSERPLFYLAIPPDAFPVVIEQLGRACGRRDARVVVEKPFGRDLASAQALSATLHHVFAEDAIFRIDHYLGKEPIWNWNHVASVHITMAERSGVDGRGGFYDSVGAIRDVVQNRLLQVTAILAMEPPNDVGGDAQRDEKAKMLRAIRPVADADVVRGQYRGYRTEPGVAADSDVETPAAARLHVDSWRWAGVPFFIRAGKCLPVTATEVVAELRRPPRELFADAAARNANYRSRR